MRVLIVDDQASQRTMLRHLVDDISPEITVADFSDPVHALLWSQEEPPDLVILDYRMPKMDGLEFARRFRRPLSQRDVPIILVTVVGDEPVRQAALEAGVIDFVVKPVRPRELRQRCKNLLELRQRQQSLKSRAYLLERQLLSGMHEIEHRERDLLRRIANAANWRSGCDGSRGERISRYAGLIAEGHGLDDDEVLLIEQAAPLLDVGNIRIPDHLLNRAGPLTDEERDIVRQHVQLGYEILGDSRSAFLQMAADIARCHHERWDGSGYPSGLKGIEIPLAARVTAIADVLDSMTTPRPYRPRASLASAMEFIRSQSGKLFDPDLVRILFAKESEVITVCRTFAPPSAAGN